MTREQKTTMFSGVSCAMIICQNCFHVKNDLNKYIYIYNLGIYNSLYPLYIKFLIWAKQYFVRKADWE